MYKRQEEDVTSTEVTVTGESVDALEEAGTALELETANGTLRIPNGSLADLSGDLSVTVTENEDGSVTAEILDGTEQAQLSVPVTLLISIDDEETGNVLYLVHEDGTRQIIPYSIADRPEALCLLDGSATVIIGNNAKTFTDVSSDSWYADSVAFAASHEMFDGVGNGLFDPQGTMTRAMIVQVLMNIEGPENSAQTPSSTFRDVPSDAWYTEAVYWASGLGLVNGYGDGTFGPADSITREQLAVLMYNYVQAMHYPISTELTGDLTQFSDADEISSWASDALSWAVGAGIVNGNADGTLNPTGTATRAEVATFMSNFTEKLLGR